MFAYEGKEKMTDIKIIAEVWVLPSASRRPNFFYKSRRAKISKKIPNLKNSSIFELPDPKIGGGGAGNPFQRNFSILRKNFWKKFWATKGRNNENILIQARPYSKNPGWSSTGKKNISRPQTFGRKKGTPRRSCGENFWRSFQIRPFSCTDS